MRKTKSRIARIVKAALYHSGMDALRRRFFSAALPVILRYHSVCTDSSLISGGIQISPEAFKEQVAYFSKYFQVLTMNQLVESIQKQTAIPKNTLVLTFDDGYADNFEAARVLKHYGMTGLFYITAGCIETDEPFWVAEVRHLIENTNKETMTLDFPDGECILPLTNQSEREQSINKITHLLKSVTMTTREDIRNSLRLKLGDVSVFPKNLMLNWSQLNEMVQMGMEIGGHTMTHPNLPSSTQDEAWEEIRQCKSLLEARLKIKVSHFAYPNGGSAAHYDNKTKVLVQKAGFLSATTSKAGKPSFESDLFELRRMRVTENLSEILWDC